MPYWLLNRACDARRVFCVRKRQCVREQSAKVSEHLESLSVVKKKQASRLRLGTGEQFLCLLSLFIRLFDWLTLFLSSIIHTTIFRHFKKEFSEWLDQTLISLSDVRCPSRFDISINIKRIPNRGPREETLRCIHALVRRSQRNYSPQLRSRYCPKKTLRGGAFHSI